MAGPPPWLQALPRAVVLLDDAGLLVEANTAAQQLYGAAATMTGRPFARLVSRAEGGGGFEEVSRRVLAGTRWRGELVLSTSDGDRRLSVDLTPVPPGGPARLLLLAEPAPPRVRLASVSERLTRLVQVAAELQSVEDLPGLTEVVVSHLADAAGATAASLSVRVAPGTLAMVAVRGGPPGAAERWATFPADETTPAGAALLGGRPLLFSGRAELERRYPDLTLAASGERSLLCLPLLVRSRGIGVVTLSFPSRVELDDELEFYRAMADVCAQALERVRAQHTVESQRATLSFLARASDQLAGSLDVEATLGVVARLAVPEHADWCTVCLERDGRLRTVAVTHHDPEKTPLARCFADTFLLDPAATASAYQVLRSGQSRLITEVDQTRVQAAATSQAQRELVHQLPFSTALVVPLVARDRVIGTLGWTRDDRTRPYTPDDLAVAEDIARRAGVAIDNALLHGELRDVAERLQAVVEPPELPAVPGWRLASYYRSAGQGTVGGDFYDAVPLEDGLLALVIGDVMGRGVEAAAAMIQLRAAIRAFVAVNPDPEVVLSQLDTFYERFPSHQLVTLIYALVDPRHDQVTAVCAGHPPPLVVRADGTVDFLSAQGTILGVGRNERRRTVAALLPGETLLLFTDGLVEHRDEDLADSNERLRRLCADLAVKAEPALLARLAEAMRDTTRDDDVAVLAASRVGPAVSEVRLAVSEAGVP